MASKRKNFHIGGRVGSALQQPDLSSTPSGIPSVMEQLVARYRASLVCSERCSFLLTPEEVASVLRVSREDVNRLITTKQLTPVCIGGQELVPVRELMELIDDYTAVSKRSPL